MDAPPRPTTTDIQEANNNNNTTTTSGISAKLNDMNSEPKNITRVRSRSSRLPVELHQALTFGDGGLGRRPPHNVLNSPDTNDYENQQQPPSSNSSSSHQQNEYVQQLSNRYYWGQSPAVAVKEHCPVVFPVKVGRSPININNNNNDNSNSASFDRHQCVSPTESVSPLPLSSAAHPVKSHPSQLKTSNLYDRALKDTVEILESPTTTDPDLYLRNSLVDFASNEESSSSDTGVNAAAGVRMIGGVQIADYEGSPRRFGATQQQQSLHLPDTSIRAEVGKSPSPIRPGFPQRVVLKAITPPEQREKCDRGKEEDPQQCDLEAAAVPSFDYVYEFSETRKVLNEFFDETNNKSKTCLPHHFQQTGDTNRGRGGNNNWSGMNCERDGGGGGLMMMISPDHRTTGGRVSREDEEVEGRQQRYQESSQDLMFLDGMSLDGGGGGGGGGMSAEMEAHIMRSSKNFTLSPETTDYDSNCGDLDSFSNDLSTGLTTDYGRLYTAMPVLEDGLSSGHASDAESHQGHGGGGIVETELQEMDSRNDGKGEEAKETESQQNVNDALKEIQTAIQRVKVLSMQQQQQQQSANGMENGDGQSPPRSPIWVPRLRASSQESLNSDFNIKEVVGGIGMGIGGIGGGGGEDDELDTDLETDRLLGQQRLEDHFFQEDNNWVLRNKLNLKGTASSVSSAIRHDTGSTLLPGSPTESRTGGDDDQSENGNSPQREGKSPTGSAKSRQDAENKNKARNKEGLLEPAVLIEGVLFRAKYLGSTQLVCEGQPTKTTRMMQAEEAVSRIKAPEGESQPSTEVDLFISTEKIMVLNTDLKEIMMDHSLRTISYIADIGELVVLMARRRLVPQDVDDAPKQNRTPKMICHVFESDEAQFIAQSIGQAFQVAYVEFLKANGIEDHSFVKEMDYQEVLNSQEIFGDELEVFAKKELQKEVVVPKAKGEILGVVIVESGWGSMLPTVVIANLLSNGAAARCGLLNIGDQIIAINGLSLVGLPLATCQTYIRNVKNQTAVKFTVVPCAPVVEVKIKRPNTKYQLGFSVQNGVICSLLRGGIAERGGVRVGHRIIEINNQSVVAVPHEKIVTLLATSVGEIHMKTMPTSMFRLLTGQENPLYI